MNNKKNAMYYKMKFCCGEKSFWWVFCGKKWSILKTGRSKSLALSSTDFSFTIEDNRFFSWSIKDYKTGKRPSKMKACLSCLQLISLNMMRFDHCSLRHLKKSIATFSLGFSWTFEVLSNPWVTVVSIKLLWQLFLRILCREPSTKLLVPMFLDY